MQKILVTAESFGYGPVITLIEVIKVLKSRLQAHFTFLGSSVSLEQAKKSSLFDLCIECDTFSKGELTSYKHLFLRSDIVISSENIEGACYGVHLERKVFYIDNLFWMWESLPEELCNVSAYFIAESFDLTENLQRLGGGIPNKRIVGPLRDLKKVQQPSCLKNQLVVNFGGAESFMIDRKLIEMYYSVILEQILQQSAKKSDLEKIIVCGGSNIVGFLKRNHKQHDQNIVFETLSNSDYLDVFYEAKYIILSPGLGNFFESLNHSSPLLFIPPINYSQYWQLSEFLNYKLGYEGLNWDSFSTYTAVSKQAPEEEGVNQVLENVRNFLSSTASLSLFASKVDAYFHSDVLEAYKGVRERFTERYKLDGIESIVSAIVEEVAKEQRCRLQQT